MAVILNCGNYPVEDRTFILVKQWAFYPVLPLCFENRNRQFRNCIGSNAHQLVRSAISEFFKLRAALISQQDIITGSLRFQFYDGANLYCN